MLSPAQIEQFRTQGFVLAEGAVPAATVAALNAVLEGWVEESRAHTANWDRMLNGKMRFDLEPGHSAEAPKLRRVGSPCDASDVYRDYLFEGPGADLVAQLVGPDVRFHHCKLNIKFPGMAAKVDWHQDLPFEPHTNRDLVTTLLLLDDMNEENGCLRVVPGSHDIWLSHYSGERFTGATDPALAEGFMRASVPIAGRAGDICLMHGLAVHGSEPNFSDRPRRLFIAEMTAADALPLKQPGIPSVHSGAILRGKAARRARLIPGEIEMPQDYAGDSVFAVQAQQAA
jgi:phytanoyl-CoA hydroxylase